ncbi:MAG: endonuclease [Bacteroidetes bacterium SW_11_45_7]|nr:MAG: endonuclease [Bacteroidetes bacterium SW_11_45_7]
MAKNRYSQLVERIFFNNYEEGEKNVEFSRSDIEKAAAALNINLPKNLGDVIYAFRFRTELPESISNIASEDEEWLIKLIGKSSYCFSLESKLSIIPNQSLAYSKILDSTPGIINKYSLTDEQALLAILRYNRLIDIFLSITCYSLQNHLRTSVPSLGQVETDEIYIGIDKKGGHFVVPVQAKGGSDKQGKVQIEQDFEICHYKFPNLICIPVAAQFMSNGKMALFSFERDVESIKIISERHYLLVQSDELTEQEVANYHKRI